MSTSEHGALTPEQAAFLRANKMASFATGRRDGSPQLSMVAYDYDGCDIAISVKSHTAKWHNAVRQPRVALLINEGHKQLIVYGRAEAISEDPERIELTARVFRTLTGKPELEVTEEFVASMDAQKRTILRITPESGLMNA